MAKTKTPALSLSARKSIGSELTFQKKGNLTMVRATPSPSDPKTLLQMYQRWEVQDYAAYFRTLSDAQKLAYFRAGARNHRTPLAEFLKEMLTDLPDIVCRYHCDSIPSNVLRDTSKNAYHGTVFGPSLTEGKVDNALLFDGIDDWVRAPLDACIVNGDISIEAFISPETSVETSANIISKKAYWSGSKFNYNLFFFRSPGLTNARLYFEYGDGTSRYAVAGPLSDWTLQEWHHICVTHDGANVRFYKNGSLVATMPSAHTLVGKADYYFALGRQPNLPSRHWKGKIDHAVVHDRVLTLDEIYLRSQRQYPL